MEKWEDQSISQFRLHWGHILRLKMVFDILQKLTNTINTGKTNTNKEIRSRKNNHNEHLNYTNIPQSVGNG